MHFHRDVLAMADTVGRHLLQTSSGDLYVGSPPLGFTFGLGALLVFPLRFLQSMGYGGIIASAVAMLVALVVLPTILRLLGGRIDVLTLPRWRDQERLAEAGRFWRGLGRLSTEPQE